MRELDAHARRLGKRPRDPGSERSTWERISVTPDIELHVRRPLDRLANKQLGALLDAARRIFEEEPR
jgi:hypothetical protein